MNGLACPGEALVAGLTVAQMRRDYAENPEQFEATYENQIMALQGSVDRVRLMHSENIKRVLKSTDEAWFVSLANEAFPKRAPGPSQAVAGRMGALCIVAVVNDQPDLSLFETGDPIAVSGRLIRFVDNVPMLQPCTVDGGS